ncbi:MAG TPA: hydroxymethylbilane synthase [Solirubrobacteraceae bacterium]|jgi:hydroxymethylbilane synthase|nr:hydroxymethylbilane synthase [Solirubrobacteraceae bacterium]
MRIGSRGSSLARVQADHVAKLLGGAEVVVIRTSGDQRSGAGGEKSRWVDTIEQALLEGEIDLAVHSAKDVPGELAGGLALLGVPERAPAEDVICGAGSLTELSYGATVGTSSLRRAAQLLAARPDLQVRELNGNVDTRLAKLSSHFDAIVLARAGLERLQREQEIGARLDPETFVPSPGQGALALEGRADDQRAAAAAEAITDVTALPCLQAERELARALQASCNTPLGAWCTPDGVGMLRLRGWVGLPDGSAWIADELEGEDPVQLAQALARRMISVGANEMLAHAEAMAP